MRLIGGKHHCFQNRTEQNFIKTKPRPFADGVRAHSANIQACKRTLQTTITSEIIFRHENTCITICRALGSFKFVLPFSTDDSSFFNV